MSIIKELKSQFSSIAWCPVKEHASMMAIAVREELTPTDEPSPKKLSLYNWNLENVEQSQYEVEESLSVGATALCWGCTLLPSQQDSQGLICVGLAIGSVDLIAPCFSEEQTWKFEKVYDLNTKFIV